MAHDSRLARPRPTFTVQSLTAAASRNVRAAGRFGVSQVSTSSARPVLSTSTLRHGWVSWDSPNITRHRVTRCRRRSSRSPRRRISPDGCRAARAHRRCDSARLGDAIHSPAVGGFYRAFKMRTAGGYEYAARGGRRPLGEGPHEFVIAVFPRWLGRDLSRRRERKPWDWDYDGRDHGRSKSSSPDAAGLFSPVDAERLAFTRIGDAGRRGLFSGSLRSRDFRSSTSSDRWTRAAGVLMTTPRRWSSRIVSSPVERTSPTRMRSRCDCAAWDRDSAAYHADGG